MRNKIDVLTFIDELSRDTDFEACEEQLELSHLEDFLIGDDIQKEYLRENHFA